MTNHEYLKQQSPEWLAAKLVKRINCSLCPVVDECIEMAKILGELYPGAKMDEEETNELD